jgi:hypothetical protein
MGGSDAALPELGIGLRAIHIIVSFLFLAPNSTENEEAQVAWVGRAGSGNLGSLGSLGGLSG